MPPPEDDARFADRHDAGRRLGQRLRELHEERPLVVGIVRGGIPVAAEVARALGAPLDVVLVRKVGAPAQPEFAIGAVAEGGVRVLNRDVVRALGIADDEVAALVAHEEHELARRLARHRGGTPPVDVAGRTVILVDDGLATGRSARAAALSLRRRGAARLVLAVPVAAPPSVRTLSDVLDDVVCLHAPPDLRAVGLWYHDFSPVSDDEVAAALDELRQPGDDGAVARRAVEIGAGPDLHLPGDLALPAAARGVVAFAHGSGSSRLSPRNRAVAGALLAAGFGTLLLDLLTAAEERDRRNVFDIPLLASRLLAAIRWLRAAPSTRSLPVGCFGASTGAAAALVAAAEAPADVGAVVSRGGRPDLAGARLRDVRAPTLLIVGSADREVLALNREALAQLRAPSDLAIVPGATHLFEEPGALEEVARLAAGWLTRHLAPAGPENP